MTRNDQFRAFMIFVKHANMDQTTEKGNEMLDGFQNAMGDVLPHDIGIGSAEFLAVLTELEEEFGVKIPPEEAHEWKSMQDLFDYLDR